MSAFVRVRKQNALALKSQPQSLDALFHEEFRSEDRVIAFAVLEKVKIDRPLPHHQNIHFRTRAALLRHLVEKHVNGAVVGKRLCWHLWTPGSGSRTRRLRF